jgi:hypothetical protein
MGDFSRDTFDKLKHYVGVRLQQGVPVLDADWNEMEDIRKYELEAFLKWFVGNGVPRGNDGFRIVSTPEHALDDFIIKGGDGTTDGAGRCLVEGWDVINESDLNFTAQPLYGDHEKAKEWRVPELEEIRPPPSGQDRTDVVYLDVWEREVNKHEDRDHLINEIIDIETCVRVKREWVVRVAQGLGDEKYLSHFLQNNNLFRHGHVYYPLARLTWIWGEKQLTREISDLRRTRLSVNDNADIDVFLNTLGSRLSDGDVILPWDLLEGLRIELDADVDPVTVGQGTCFVTVEFPESEPAGQQVGYTHPLALAANAVATGSSISWQPLPGVETYLKRQWQKNGLPSARERFLTRLVLKGNLISVTPHIHSRLSSRDLERWFWLAPPDAKLTGSVARWEQFGCAVAISGNIAVVGACCYENEPFGAAYVFVRDGNGDWGEGDKLLPAEHIELMSLYGEAVAISGNTAVVGAPLKNEGGHSTGAAYVFVYDEQEGWGEGEKLLPAEHVEAGAEFGKAVAISGDTAVVGAPQETEGGETGAGAAYVFQRNQGGAEAWGQTAKLTAEHVEEEARFGSAVAISGNTAVVGAGTETWEYDGEYYHNAGAAYVFVFDEQEGWGKGEKLPLATEHVESGAFFGSAVAISGDTTVVGALGEIGVPVELSGAAYVLWV